MARIRSIKVDLFLDDGLAEVSLEAHFLLAGLPCLADSAGRLEDRPRRIQAQIFPYRPTVNVDACLDELSATGHVLRYEANGARFLQVSNWDADQRPHVKEANSVIPPPMDSSEHRTNTGKEMNSPGARRELAGGKTLGSGIMGVGSGVLDLGCGDLPPAASASAAPEQRTLLPTHEAKPAKKAKAAKEPEPKGDPRHGPLSLALTGLGWPHHGGRTAKALKSLLMLADQVPGTAGDKAQAEILRRAAAAKASTKFPLVRELHELAERWGHFAAPTEPTRPSILPRADDPEWETV